MYSLIVSQLQSFNLKINYKCELIQTVIIYIIKYNDHTLFQYLLSETSVFFMLFFFFLHKLQMLQFGYNFHHFFDTNKKVKVDLFNEDIAYRLIMLNITIFDIIAAIT